MVLAGAAVLLSTLTGDRGPDPAAQEAGVVALEVTLEEGFARPHDGAPVPGRVIEIPDGGRTLILAAPIGHRFALRFRAGGEWGPWASLEAEVHEGPDRSAAGGGEPSPSTEGSTPDVMALGPVLVDELADEVEVVRQAGDGAALGVTFLLDSYRGRGELAPDAGPAAVAGRQVERAPAAATGPAMPGIMPRSSWTGEGWASGNSGCSGGPWYADNIQAVVVHHTVNGNNYRTSDVDDLLRAIHYAHVRVNGWCDVGYNFVVDRFGTIWEGRVGGIDRPVVGGHAKGFNTSTVGVAMLGQHQVGASPAPARTSAATEAAVERLAGWKLGRHGVDPAGTTWLRNRSTEGPQRLVGGELHLVPTVLGHRDLGLTACPGNYGLDLARRLVPLLAASRQVTPPYTFEGWTPAAVGPGFVTLDLRGGLRPAGSAAIAGIGAATAGTGPDALPSPHPLAIAAVRQGQAASGYVLHADGVLHPFGGAPALSARPAGTGTPVDVALASGGTGGWVISAGGGVHGFGGQPDRPVGGSPGGPVIAAALDGSGDGYLLDGQGRLRPVGQAHDRQIGGGPVQAVDVAVRWPSGGGWVLDAGGGLHPFGGAPAVSITGPGRPAPARSFEAVVGSLSGQGGWLLSDDGQLWPFGGERLVLPVSTDATAADVIDLAVVESAVPAGLLASSEARYVAAAVQLFLGRAATQEEVGYWHHRLATDGAGRHALTTALARSDEWAGARIDAMYADVLGRPADEGGRRYWLDQVGAGMSLQAVGAHFYGSDEYYRAGPSASDYVTRLYRVLLGRAPDPAGLAYWSGILESGRARPLDVAAGFYASPESRRQRVAALYQSVLGRSPDGSGLAFWSQRLLAAGDVELAADLAASDEFHAIAVG